MNRIPLDQRPTTMTARVRRRRREVRMEVMMRKRRRRRRKRSLLILRRLLRRVSWLFFLWVAYNWGLIWL